METLNSAAVYYLKYIGKRGTDKQVEKLLKQVGPLVIKLAVDRGWKMPRFEVAK